MGLKHYDFLSESCDVDPPILDNGFPVTLPPYAVGDTVEYECNSGFDTLFGFVITSTKVLRVQVRTTLTSVQKVFQIMSRRNLELITVNQIKSVFISKPLERNLLVKRKKKLRSYSRRFLLRSKYYQGTKRESKIL